MSTATQEAARWFARLQGAPKNHPDRKEFETWLAKDPSHAVEFAAFGELLQELRTGLNSDALAEVMQQRQSRARKRRKVLKQGLAGVLLAGAGLELASYASRHRTTWQMSGLTGIGDLRQQRLMDGTQVILGAASDVAVRFNGAERHAELRRGAAIFDVASDPQRPFTVDAGKAYLTVLGTRFVVNRLSTRVKVAVEHGRVQVDAGRFWRHNRLTLTEGQVAEATGPDALRVLAQRASDEFAFAHGTLMFDQADLAGVVETLSRYRNSPVRMRREVGTDPNVRSPRIVGVLKTSEVEAFIDLLPRLAPVSVSRENGVAWISVTQ